MTSRQYAVAATALMMTSPLWAQIKESTPYPTRPIRFIAPTPPGSPPDLVARAIGEKLALAFGKPVIIDNRPGATGTIAIKVMSKSAPDGHTLAAIGMPPLALARLLSPPPFNSDDLIPISLVAWNYNILAVPSSSPMQSVGELIAVAKARPGALKYSSAGNMTPAHLASELFKREANVDIMQVNYKGAADSVAAMLSGEVDMNIGAVGALSIHVKSGRLRALATSAPRRILAYPNLPTFTELGYPGVQLRDLQAVAAPAGTPRDVITRLSLEIAKATASADVKGRLESLGIEAASAGPEQTAKHIFSELRIWSKVIRDAGIKLD